MKNKTSPPSINNINLSEIQNHLTEEGSLGILAYGDLGLLAWRRVKNETIAKTKSEHNGQ